jgi:hypothetical protein
MFSRHMETLKKVKFTDDCRTHQMMIMDNCSSCINLCEDENVRDRLVVKCRIKSPPVVIKLRTPECQYND